MPTDHVIPGGLTGRAVRVERMNELTGMRNEPKVLGIVLAGGEGKRLLPLTQDRAKPAVPFGGHYRLVDFVLSNLVNAGLRQIAVLTQYKSHSLDRHISLTWRMSTFLGNYVTPVPAQQRLGPHWYQGSADAIFQSLNLIYDAKPDYVVVFGADHVYRMDAAAMVDAHIESGAAVTVAGIGVPRQEATAFGVIQRSGDSPKITAFLEKPADPPGVPGRPHEAFASMGNYVFSTRALVEALAADAGSAESLHDMGRNIIPMLTDSGQSFVYDFADNYVPGSTERDRDYWRDVGTLDSYHEAHMDLVSIDPIFNLYNNQWPIFSLPPQVPGAKFVEGGRAHESIVSGGAIIAGGLVDHSVIAPNVRVEAGASVVNSVIMEGAVIGKRAIVHDAVLDKGVVVPDGAVVGMHLARERERGHTVSANGVTAVGKGVRVERD